MFYFHWVWRAQTDQNLLDNASCSPYFWNYKNKILFSLLYSLEISHVRTYGWCCCCCFCCVCTTNLTCQSVSIFFSHVIIIQYKKRLISGSFFSPSHFSYPIQFHFAVATEDISTNLRWFFVFEFNIFSSRTIMSHKCFQHLFLSILVKGNKIFWWYRVHGI